MLQIVVDNRERAIIPHLDKYCETYHLGCQTKQMTVGDYAICIDDVIKIIIERKTWIDLAASMTDGRKDNVNKLFKLRQDTNCSIVYLIEGNACPATNKFIGRFPYKNLLAHLDHLRFRDNVQIVHTLGHEQTAERLCLMAINYSTIKSFPMDYPKYGGQVIEQNNNEAKLNEENQILNLVENEIIDEESKTTNVVESKINVVESKNKVPLDTTESQITLLTAKQEAKLVTDEQLLRCFPSIGSMVSTALVDAKISFLDICNHRYQPEHYAKIKFNTGKMFGIERGRKIELSYKMVNGDSNSQIAKKVQKKIMQCVPRMGKTADILLRQFSLIDIIRGKITYEQLRAIDLNSKRKLGPMLAKNILKVLAGIDVGQTTELDANSDENLVPEENQIDNVNTETDELTLDYDLSADV